MTIKYESEILFDLMKRDGDDAPSDVLPYESELKEKYLEQVKGAYPKVQDYHAEWLNYNLNYLLPSYFPIESVTNVTSACFNNVVPHAYISAILKGNTGYRDIDTGEFLETFEEDRNLELVSVKMPVLKTFGKNLLEPNKISQVKNETVNIHIRNIIKANVDYVITFDNNGVNWKGCSFYLRNSSGGNAGYFATYDNMCDGRSGVRFRFTEEQVYGLNNGGYLQLYNANVPDIESRPFDFQIEESSIATSYEPFKSIILTVNEDVTLRSNGSVCDELDLLTGKLTQRIDEDGEILTQEVVKTVDLTCINEQDESEAFRPIEGTMHVSTSSQTIPPLLDMSVPVEATTQNLMSFVNIVEGE